MVKKFFSHRKSYFKRYDMYFFLSALLSFHSPVVLDYFESSFMK